MARSRLETLEEREFAEAWVQHAQSLRAVRLLTWGARAQRHRTPRRWVYLAALHTGGAWLRLSYLAWCLKMNVR